MRPSRDAGALVSAGKLYVADGYQEFFRDNPSEPVSVEVEGMPETLPVEKLAALDAAYTFTGTPNGEIAQRWYPLAVRSGYTQAHAAMAEFLQRIGRRKLIMPTYSELAKTPEGLKLAEEIFAKARPGYHPITTGSVEQVIAEGRGAR